MSEHQNGWNEYSKLVLKELETLGEGIEGVRGEIQSIKQDIALIKSREDKVDDLRSWKERMDEVSSPTQLQKTLEEVEQLKIFKTKAITIFAVIQFAMAAIMFGMKFIGK